MTETELLLSLIDDKLRKCEDGYMLTHTHFLSPGERSAAMVHLKNRYPNHVFWGGFPDAERTVLFLLPDYMEKDGFSLLEEDEPLCLISCRTTSSRALTHRDYLGALLGLGIERDVIGDILVHENGADIIAMKSISDYLLANFTKVASASLKISVDPIQNLIPPTIRTELVRESVASLRLDNMLSAVFNVSRSAASEAIARGTVFVNDIEASKPDMRISEGDKLVLRGKGKAYFREQGGMTRKGRLSVLFEKYI